MAIERKITSLTSGSGDSESRVFVTNTLVDRHEIITSPFSFAFPVFTINGATYKYYTQTTAGISASLNNIKTVKYVFSANTTSLTGTTKMKHDIYRINYDVYTAATQAVISLSSLTIPNTTVSGVNTTTTTVSTDSISSFSNAIVNVYSAITEPIYTVIEETSGATFISASAHTLTLPQQIKPTGQYTQNLFLDKSQYFIDSQFLIETPLDQTLGDVRTFSGGQEIQLYDMPYSSTTYIGTGSNSHTITGGTFSGTSISGATFTYFVPPKKADIFVVNGQPAVIGDQNTFAPIFSFKNVEDGDYYRLQVTYNTGDTVFTGATTTFKLQSQPGGPEYVRTAAVALTPNAEFLYRIGNTKEIINLFKVKQNVTTWSEQTYAKAANDGSYLLTGHTWLNYIGNPINGAILNLTIQTNISVIDLGSDEPSDPNVTSEVSNPLAGGVGTVITVVSEPDGSFSFGKIGGGQYTLTADSGIPGYDIQTFNFYLSQDTNLDIIFAILWGNTTIDFQQPYTFL